LSLFGLGLTPCLLSFYSQLRNCIAAVSKDSTKFFEGNNKAAGTRARKHLQELKSLAQVCSTFRSVRVYTLVLLFFLVGILTPSQYDDDFLF